jgi:hypothetical protein
MALKAKKRKAPAKKAPARRRSTVKKAATTVKTAVRRRYKKTSGKMNIKNVLLDIAAIAGGVVAGGIVGQTLAKQGVDSRISGIVPAAAGGVLALKVKNPIIKMLGIGMGAAAGVSMINNVTKATNLLGVEYESPIDSVDVYNNPDLLGVPVSVDGIPALGVPVELSGTPDWTSGVQVG